MKKPHPGFSQSLFRQNFGLKVQLRLVELPMIMNSNSVGAYVAKQKSVGF